jgi:ChpA-C
MKKVRWVPATAGTALVAAALALPGAGVAYASGNGDVTGIGNIPVVSGNTITAPVSAPVNLCGLAVAVAGSSDAGCAGGSSSAISPGDSGGSGSAGSHNGNVTGAGNVPLGSGNTLTAPVSVPVNVCGVSGAVAGVAHSGCRGGSSSTISGVGDGSHNGNVTGAGNIPVLSGNTITAPVSAPVNVCGIAVAVLGLSSAGCEGGSDSCIGSHCNTPCTNCHSRPPCLGNDCHTPRPCTGNCHTPRPCTADCGTPRPCMGNNCGTPPPCTSNCHTPPPCHGSRCTPPGCRVHCPPDTPPGPPQGAGPGGPGGTATTVTTRTMAGRSLPTTGADLLLLGAAALGTVGAGTGAIAFARRRRTGDAS